MKIVYGVIISTLICPRFVNAQLLGSIIPVTCTHSNLPDTVSFILTATDFNNLGGAPAKYISSLQIIDANNPWPPRWFATNPPDTSAKSPFVALMPYNASFQQNKVIFYGYINNKSENAIRGPHLAFILCNRQLEPVDTFFPNNRGMDAHDFRLSPNGEKLYFEVEDTLAQAKAIFGVDTMVRIEYEDIDICNSHDSTIFRWSPFTHLGLKAMYLPYADITRVIMTSNTFGWSHGSSLCFDYDGNILYSFKHIGIGKISRKDGHIIWRIDRNNLKPNELSDTIPLYLQHDFKSVKDENGNIIYTVLSNGDALHPQCEAVQFTVKEPMGSKPVIKLLKDFVAPKNITTTSAGNYDVEANGNYLVNYGLFRSDKLVNHVFFEYRDKEDDLLAQYTIPYQGFCYRVHKLDNWAPQRPRVIIKNGWLSYEHKGPAGTWYQLSGKDLKIVNKVGSGKKFKPLENGYYCLAVKYGIGYSVSEPIKYTR